MKTGLTSLCFTMVHCCRRKFVGLCRINHFCVWTGNEGGSEGPNTTKQGIDWIVLLCTFVGCLLRLQWPAFVYVCLLSGHAASDGHRIPDQGALSLCLCFKKDKLWTPCFSFAEKIAWQVVDYFRVEINWLQPVRRWRIERGPPNPRTRHAKMWPRETSWKWWNVEHDNDSKGYLFFGNVALLSLPFMSIDSEMHWKALGLKPAECHLEWC